MRRIDRFNWLGVGLSVLLLSCTASPTASNPPSTPASGGQTPDSAMTRLEPPAESLESESAQTNSEQAQGQSLPIAAEAEIKGQIIQLEVARTPQEQAMGLMYRPPLPDDRGMLFLFNPPRPVRFWMKNTPSPLDMVFLKDGEVQAITVDAPPCEADPCPTYGPDNPVEIDQVIELRSGRAAELGLEVGDRVEVRFLEEPL
ncbi:MAG: hypothetical protein Kow00121_61710 [Elainellaceae cyanobacterium]